MANKYNNLLKGKSNDIIQANVKTLQDQGYAPARAMRTALCCANKHDSAKRAASKVAKKQEVTRVKLA